MRYIYRLSLAFLLAAVPGHFTVAAQPSPYEWPSYYEWRELEDRFGYPASQAHNGSVRAQWALGVMYRDGQFCRVDEQRML